ncbi:MAG: hypothetical protein VB032_03600 [Burkholderiaceae bacterium]|nr:hypothetical protein [Burkholderiaceae bacterium]
MKLSEKIKPNVDAAPWVIEEIGKLEARLEKSLEELHYQRDRNYDPFEPENHNLNYTRLRAVVDEIENR